MGKAQDYWKDQGKNFMTPRVIEHIDAPNGRLIELSEGTGFDNEPIFGVSVADAEGNRLLHPTSQMFFSLGEARKHIRKVSR